MKSEYSDCRAVIGAVAAALRMVAALASDRPRWADLAGSDELGHRADGLLDRNGLVDPVLVVEVDVVDAQPLE